MAERKDWGAVGLDVNAGSGPTAHEIGSDSPFRILIAGDFSGRANRGVRTPVTRAVEVDRDNLDEVMASLGTAIQLPVIGAIASRRSRPVGVTARSATSSTIRSNSSARSADACIGRLPTLNARLPTSNSQRACDQELGASSWELDPGSCTVEVRDD